MTKFYIVRHGETFFNEIGRVQGWCDSPLTKKGEQQASSLYEPLKDVDFDCVYCSTLKRCHDTMSLILKNRTIPVVYSDLFKEIHFGTKEAMLIQDAFPNGSKDFTGYTEFGGETKEQARNRFMKGLNEIVLKYPNSSILVVTHGSVLKEGLAFIDSGFLQDFIEANGSVKTLLPNCSLSIVDFDGQYHLESYGKIYY